MPNANELMIFSKRKMKYFSLKSNARISLHKNYEHKNLSGLMQRVLEVQRVQMMSLSFQMS